MAVSGQEGASLNIFVTCLLLAIHRICNCERLGAKGLEKEEAGEALVRGEHVVTFVLIKTLLEAGEDNWPTMLEPDLYQQSRPFDWEHGLGARCRARFAGFRVPVARGRGRQAVPGGVHRLHLRGGRLGVSEEALGRWLRPGCRLGRGPQTAVFCRWETALHIHPG